MLTRGGDRSLPGGPIPPDPLGSPPITGGLPAPPYPPGPLALVTPPDAGRWRDGPAGGQTSITVTQYHAVGADPVNPETGAKGAPTPDYTEFETFTLVRPRQA